jgi:NTP pyrophosphatase (non-canonical NTP hydrolase)
MIVPCGGGPSMRNGGGPSVYQYLTEAGYPAKTDVQFAEMNADPHAAQISVDGAVRGFDKLTGPSAVDAGMRSQMASVLCLDELYRMTAHIYSEQNAHRPASATFAHFVEVCGILSMHSRKKKREDVTFEDALCKALGWYFPLMAKFKVRSVEELIYRKYPYTCPYCRETPHVDSKCKTVYGTTRTVNHVALRQKYVENRKLRPLGIGEWQEMFARVYPRGLDESARSVVGLFEELGELAEAVRVFDRYPKYFIGEAADVFSYLMGLANEYALQRERDELESFDLEAEFLRRYPGLCMQCGYQVCVCPSVPASTVGRMAKELDVEDMDDLFASDFEEAREESINVSAKVLKSVGGYAGLSMAYPFDRGEANRNLVLFCLELADRIGDEDVATRLRSAALKAGSATTTAGSPKKPGLLDEILGPIQKVLDENKSEVATALGVDKASLPNSVGSLIIGELIMGDKHVLGNSITQGSGLQTVNPDFTVRWREIEPSIDLKKLSQELALLRGRIELSADPEKDIALERVSEAEAAALKGDGSRMLSALYAAGRVGRDLAIGIGSGLIVEVIKKANFM